MSAFRFFDLPDELRLKMYRFMLPYHERLHLDPDNVQFPIPYRVPESYGVTFNLLQVCKRVHAEATELIYKHNTVNIIETCEAGNFLQDLGYTACRNLTKLECHVEDGLVDLGSIWSTMMECPRLTDVRLVFYHELRNWLKTLAQLAYYRQRFEDKCHLDLSIELHTSIWAPHYPASAYKEQFNFSMEEAKRHANIYTYELPSQLRHITITASVHRTAEQAFAAWVDEGSGWGFRRVTNTDTEQKKTLQFVKVAEPQN